MKGARILVVDDSATILKVVSGMLVRSGYVPQTARDGLMGIELIKRGHTFDLVLLDFVMPRMNGYQFCRELRAHSANKSLPVVLMSAKADKIREQFAQQTGAVESITKPFDEDSLAAAVESGLARAAEKAAREAARDSRPSLDLTEDTISERGIPRGPMSERGGPRSEGDLSRRIAAAAVQRILRMSPRERMSTSDLEKAIVEAFARTPTSDLREPPRSEADRREKAAEVLGGDLSVVPLAEVMQLLQMQRQTGILRVKDGARQLTMALKDGLIELARLEGGPDEFRIGRYFLEQGVATRAQVEDAALRVASSKKLLGQELVDSRVVSDAAREEALRMQSSEIVYELLRWRAGRFSLTQPRADRHPLRIDTSEEKFSRAAENARLGLGIAGLLLEGFRRLDEWHAMETTIVWDQVVTIDEVAKRGAEASLSRLERRILETVDGRRSIKQIVEESYLGSFDAVKTVHQFLKSRLLRPGGPSAAS